MVHRVQALPAASRTELPSYASTAVIDARSRSRREPLAAGSREARCSIAAVDPGEVGEG